MRSIVSIKYPSVWKTIISSVECWPYVLELNHTKSVNVFDSPLRHGSHTDSRGNSRTDPLVGKSINDFEQAVNLQAIENLKKRIKRHFKDMRAQLPLSTRKTWRVT